MLEQGLNGLVVGGVIVWAILCLGLTLALIAILGRELMELTQRVSAIGDALAQQTANLNALAKQLNKQGATLDDLIRALERGLIIQPPTATDATNAPVRATIAPAKRETK